MRAWVYQDPKQLKEKGAKLAGWCVGWYDPDGKRRCKSCGIGSAGKSIAGKLAEKISGQLVTGTYDRVDKKSWQQFRDDFAAKVLDGMEYRTREQIEISLGHFERLMKPARVSTITSRTIADFVAKRRMDPRTKRATVKVARATVNRDLRNIRMVLRKAEKWGYLAKVPDFEFLKEIQKLPTYIGPEQFQAIYANVDSSQFPRDVPNIAPADWWRGLLVMAFMTGWRIGQILALKWEDVDLEKGTVITRGDANKGKRDSLVELHSLAVEHFHKLKGSFSPVVFPWPHSRRQLFIEFRQIQKAAGVAAPAGKNGFGFHDIRRGFATMNAGRMTPDALQNLMQHRDYQTTQLYINMARQLRPATENLFVPDLTAPKKENVVG